MQTTTKVCNSSEKPALAGFSVSKRISEFVGVCQQLENFVVIDGVKWHITLYQQKPLPRFEAMALTDTAIKALKAKDKPYKITDGGRLYLLIRPNGSKLWQQAYTFAGKEKVLSHGAYPLVSLSDARKKRDAAKKLLLEGSDPSVEAKLMKIAAQAEADNSFNALADEFIAKSTREGLAAVTLKKKEWLISLARPDIGSRPIAKITAAEILIPLRKVEAEGNYETARRLRSTIGQVFRYAIATARAENDPTFGLRGALTTPTVTHRAELQIQPH